MNKTKFENHIKHLQDLHNDLNNKIKESYLRYETDIKVSSLKKKKLKLKDEIKHMEKVINGQYT
jgi:uncharacterized protein YdcH (DUF465 family)